MSSKRYFTAVAILLCILIAKAADRGAVLDFLDMSRPGMDKVSELRAQNNDSLAAEALLDYFRTRNGVKSIGVDASNPHLSDDEQRWADEALEHKFFVHQGYQPSFFYGDDINWQYWPVKDNELRWQLHRTKWWVPMGKAYRITGDEKYAREWVTQYRDWIKKNPLTKFDGIKDKDLENADNVYFAWRPLEVCDRLEHQIEQFELFLPSENFTADFLIDFLDNYHRHAEFVNSHYSKQGNHLLFEAQRIIFAGAFFPEFKDAPLWRKSGVEILNREIEKQVYNDGSHFELDPRYHIASINIFGKALQMMDANGYCDEFPASYLETVGKMIEFAYNITFPDYTLPMFSDNKLYKKEEVLSTFRSWRKMAPNDKALHFFASLGDMGSLPEYTSRAFPMGGFYVLRNGWTSNSTIMMLKAGPAGEWHNQSDNGTFELWANGRNFFPDSGSFIYGGDDEVLAQRNWFRQTAVHNTLTLDNKNLQTRKSRLLKWESSADGDVVVVETPGYDGLTHRRAVFFVNKEFFVIADEAYGDAIGNVALHYQLLPCQPLEKHVKKSLNTNFADGNNITLQVFGADQMKSEEGWSSPDYRIKNPRPAYMFNKEKKSSKPVRFITVVHPSSAKLPSPHSISAKYIGTFSTLGASINVSVDGIKYKLSYTL